ncbi:MAG: TlpA family protein disulfide reductase [Dechloromonas sp.]|nr:TlpA family protein disulfide reductase [Dechloromonas sp.]
MKKLLAALLLCLSAALVAAQEAPDSTPFFAAKLIDPDEKPVAMTAYRGKPLVVNFWARWCPPCRAEIPELNEFRKHHGGKIEVLGIAVEDTTEADGVKAFARDFPIRYPVFLAGGNAGTQLMRTLGNPSGGLPYTLFIDRRGRVVGHKVGMLRQRDLDAVAPRLLAP